MVETVNEIYLQKQKKWSKIKMRAPLTNNTCTHTNTIH